MTERTARTLRFGDRVQFKDGCIGVVMATSVRAFLVYWTDGRKAWIDYGRAALISKLARLGVV